MPALRIQIKSSRLFSHNGVNVEEFHDDYAKGNGWKVYMSEDGNLTCYAAHNYQGVRNQLKFEIYEGTVKVSLKIGNRAPKILKKYNLPKWPVDGVIGLPGGPVDKRKPYFTDADFQMFLDKHGLNRVSYELASGYYNIIKEENGDSWGIIEDIQTDGIITNSGREIVSKETDPHTVRQVVNVIHASWVIKTIYKDGNAVFRTLYTLDNPRQLKGLPKPE